jgi:putative drug exporter of the RND superfamily
MSSMIKKFPKSIILVWILILFASLPFASKLQNQLLSSGIEVKDSESFEASELINDNFSGLSEEQVTVIVSSSSDVSGEEISRVIDVIENEQNVQKVKTIEQEGKTFISVGLSEGGNKFVANIREKLKSEELDIVVTGGPAISLDIGQVSQDNVKLVERIGLPIVFVLLIIVFRSIVSALLPIMIGLFSIVTSSAVLYLVSFQIEMSPLLSNIVTMLGLGIAIDYALFITRRFNSELARNNPKEIAVEIALKTSGKSVFYAGMTVALTLLSLFVSNTLITNSVAIGGFVVVFMSIILSLSLLPAVLYILGKKVNFLQIKLSKKESRPSIWNKLIDLIFKKPVLSLVVGVILVSSFIPAAGKLDIHLPVGAYQELPESTESREGMELLEEQMGIGNIFPIDIVVETSNSPVSSKENLELVQQLTTELENQPNVSKVISLTNWNKDFNQIAEYEQVYNNLDKAPSEVKDSLSAILSENKSYSIIKVIPEVVPYSKEARTLVTNIREQIIPEYQDDLSLKVTGETANGLDIDEKIINSMPLTITLILVLTFILLLFAFKSIILPLKAIVLNVLVTGSSLGFVVFMFQQGHFPGATEGPINVNTPLIMFALLFGLSIDYEVIIISRIREHYLKTNNLYESIKSGFTETVGMINGAALIMIVVFGVFVFADFQIIQELGTSLAFAIMLDVLIVRTILVPSSMYLLGKWNWYLPGKKNQRLQKDIALDNKKA